MQTISAISNGWSNRRNAVGLKEEFRLKWRLKVEATAMPLSWRGRCLIVHKVGIRKPSYPRKLALATNMQFFNIWRQLIEYDDATADCDDDDDDDDNNDADMSMPYSDDDLVHEAVDVSSFELGPAAVHHQLGVSSGEQHEPVAPGRVA